MKQRQFAVMLVMRNVLNESDFKGPRLVISSHFEASNLYVLEYFRLLEVEIQNRSSLSENPMDAPAQNTLMVVPMKPFPPYLSENT